MRGRGAGRAIMWAIVEYPDEDDPAILKREADKSEHLTGQGVMVDTVKLARRYAQETLAELDQRGYLTTAGRRALAPLLD